MSCWEFDLGSAPSCSLAEGGYTKVQFATQDITSWPLDPPDWSTPTVLESPFTVPEIGLHAPLEAGLMGANEISLECDNRDLLDSVGDYSGVRIFDLLRGRVTGDTFDVDVTDLHVRILFKSPTDLDYSVRWWGVVDYKDLEARLSQLADPDTFYIKLHAIDSIFQLEKRNMIDFVTDMDAMQMSNAYTSDYKFLSFYGTLVYGTQTIRPGAYELVNVRWYDGSRTDWLGNRRSSPLHRSAQRA